jgi:hypothetical protein
MNCREFRNKADNEFRERTIDFSSEMKKHADSCIECAAYTKELAALRGALAKPSLSIRPGELDDITFEKIATLASEKGRRRASVRIAWPVKWILAPLTVAAVAAIIFILAKPVQKTDNPFAGIAPYSSVEIENSILSSDSAGVELLTSLAASDTTSLGYVSDELLSNSEINDILGSMSVDELKTLYDKINNLKG